MFWKFLTRTIIPIIFFLTSCALEQPTAPSMQNVHDPGTEAYSNAACLALISNRLLLARYSLPPGVRAEGDYALLKQAYYPIIGSFEQGAHSIDLSSNFSVYPGTTHDLVFYIAAHSLNYNYYAILTNITPATHNLEDLKYFYISIYGPQEAHPLSTNLSSLTNAIIHVDSKSMFGIFFKLNNTQTILNFSF